MKRNRWWWVFLFLLAAFGCGGDDDDDAGDDADDDVDDDADDDTEAPSPCDWSAHDPLIAAGKALLGDNRIHEGYEAFADALALCPTSADARMGLALACQLQLERDMYAMIEFLLSVVPEFKAGGDDKSFMSTLQAILINQLYPKALEMRGHAHAIRGAPPGWSFYIERYPFIVQGEFEEDVWVDLGGEWDAADAVMVEAEAQAYAALILFLNAYDLTFDWHWFLNFPDLGGRTVPEMIALFSEWLLGVIEDPDYPTFLLLRGELGAEFLVYSGYATGAMMADARESALAIVEETDDQSDDVAGWVDENGNDRFDPGEPYRLPYFGVLNDDQNRAFLGFLSLFFSLGRSIWDGGKADANPHGPDEVLLSEFNFILEALGLEPLLPPFPVNAGPFFNDPQPDALKEMLRGLARFLYDASHPGADREVGS